MIKFENSWIFLKYLNINVVFLLNILFILYAKLNICTIFFVDFNVLIYVFCQKKMCLYLHKQILMYPCEKVDTIIF